jgi:kynureninase
MLEGLIEVRGSKYELVLVDDPRELVIGDIDLDDVAVVLLTHVSYRTGRMLEMKAITAAVHTGYISTFF